MDRLLKKGDVFTVRRLLPGLCWVHEHEFVDEKLVATKGLVTIDYNTEVHWTEHQKKAGGWEREVERVLDIDASAFASDRWKVESTRLTGGGTGMGPHDVYPDGHYVEAKSLNHKGVRLVFYQTGAFIPEILPPDIDLVKGKR